MPRVIRVGDADDDITHPGDPGPNRMVDNGATMWLDEGASNAGAANVDVASLLGFASLDIPEAEIARVYEEVQRDTANRVRVDRQEYVETTEGGGRSTSGGSSGVLPAGTIGTVQEPPPGANGAHPDWNTFEAQPNDDYLNWGGADSRVDPAIAEIARRMSRSLGVKLNVNSGYRDRARNAACDGASNSNHMYGVAMDIAYIGGSGEERRRMLVAAIEAGAQGIGHYDSYGFMHIDLGPKRTWRLPHPGWAVETMRAAGYAA
jgi:hypothetical protein